MSLRTGWATCLLLIQITAEAHPYKDKKSLHPGTTISYISNRQHLLEWGPLEYEISQMFSNEENYYVFIWKKNISLMFVFPPSVATLSRQNMLHMSPRKMRPCKKNQDKDSANNEKSMTMDIHWIKVKVITSKENLKVTQLFYLQLCLPN